MSKSFLILIFSFVTVLFSCEKKSNLNPNQVVNDQIRTDSISGTLYKDCNYVPDTGRVFHLVVMQENYNVFASVFSEDIKTDARGRFKSKFTFKYEKGSGIFTYDSFLVFSHINWPFASVQPNAIYVESDTVNLKVKLLANKPLTSSDTIYYWVTNGIYFNKPHYVIGPYNSSVIDSFKIPREAEYRFGDNFDTTSITLQWAVGRNNLEYNNSFKQLVVKHSQCNKSDTVNIVTN